MNLRLLATPLLATTLLLSTLGCSKKEDPAPPALEGTWDLASAVITSYVNGSPQSQITTTYPGRTNPNGSYLVITSTTMQGFYNYGGTSTPVEYYTRSGNALAVSIIPTGSSTSTLVRTDNIVQLTSTDLTILSKTPATPPSSDYYASEAHYKRR